ncbi:hypothetical protein D3C80_1482300 [compost metagenome]
MGEDAGLADHFAGAHATGFDAAALLRQGHADHAGFDDQQFLADLPRRQQHLAGLEGRTLHLRAEAVLFLVAEGGEQAGAAQHGAGAGNAGGEGLRFRLGQQVDSRSL